MSRVLVLLALSLSLLACGEPGTSEDGPKSRSNDRGPIEREVERRAPPRAEPSAPVAEAPARPAPRVVRTRRVTRPEPVARAEATPRPAVTAPTEEPAVAAEAEPASEAPRVPEPGQITLARVVATAAIENREPIGAPLLADAPRVFAFVEAANTSDVDTELSVVFVSPDGQRGRPVALSLPAAPRWRTWASTRHTHGQPGRWTIVVSDAAGRELARQPFEVTPAAGDAA